MVSFGAVNFWYDASPLFRRTRVLFMSWFCTKFAKCRSFSTKSFSAVYGLPYPTLASITAAIRKKVSYARLGKRTKRRNKSNENMLDITKLEIKGRSKGNLSRCLSHLSFSSSYNMHKK